jgi:hypothetical protein
VKSVAGGLVDLGLSEQWAANEARLVAALPSASPWLLMIHEKPPEHAAILEAFREAGIQLDSVAGEKRSSLWRVAAPSAQAPSAVSTSSTLPQR